MTKEEKYESPVATIIYRGDLFFEFMFKKTDAPYNAKEVQRQFDFFFRHTQGKNYKVIMEGIENQNIPTDEAFAYFFKFNRPESKSAIVTDSLPISIFMQQMFKNGRVSNVRLFKSKQKAIQWLNQDNEL